LILRLTNGDSHIVTRWLLIPELSLRFSGNSVRGGQDATQVPVREGRGPYEHVEDGQGPQRLTDTSQILRMINRPRRADTFRAHCRRAGTERASSLRGWIPLSMKR